MLGWLPLWHIMYKLPYGAFQQHVHWLLNHNRPNSPTHFVKSICMLKYFYSSKQLHISTNSKWWKYTPKCHASLRNVTLCISVITWEWYGWRSNTTHMHSGMSEMELALEYKYTIISSGYNVIDCIHMWMFMTPPPSDNNNNNKLKKQNNAHCH